MPSGNKFSIYPRQSWCRSISPYGVSEPKNYNPRHWCRQICHYDDSLFSVSLSHYVNTASPGDQQHIIYRPNLAEKFRFQHQLDQYGHSHCNWSISQIPQRTSPISHNASFCNRNVHMHAHFCYKIAICGIFVWCIVEFCVSPSLFSHRPGAR